MMTTPTTISRVRWWVNSVRPMVANRIAMAVKVTANPTTNSTVPASTRPRIRGRVLTATATPPPADPSATADRSRSEPARPVT
jgi:hypothetical protein